MIKKMTYRESLPTSCPPIDPNVPDEPILWRLLFSNTVKDDDFDSQYKKQPTRNFYDQCGARSVSLTTSLEVCRALVKSPRMPKFTHAVQVLHDPTTGVWHKDKPTHVHWWPYKASDPLNVVVGQVAKL